MPQRPTSWSSVPRIGSILRQRLFSKQRKPRWDVLKEQHLPDAAGHSDQDPALSPGRVQRLLGCELMVQVKAASGLRGTDWHNTSSPYCTVQLGTAQHRTQAAEAQLAPQWGSTFAFPPRVIVAAKQQQQLVVRFEVWHEEAFGLDCFLGQAALDLTVPDLHLQQPCQVLLPLRVYTSKGKLVEGDHGLLHVALWLVPLVTPTSSVMASAPTILAGAAPGPLVEVNSVATGATARLARQLPCTYTNTIGTLYEEPCVVILKVTLVCLLDVDRLLKSHAAADAIAAAEAAAAAADAEAAASVSASEASQPGTPLDGSAAGPFSDSRHPSEPDLKSKAGSDANGSSTAAGGVPPAQQVAAHRDSQFFLGPMGGLVEGEDTSWKALNKFLGTLQGGRAYTSPAAQASADKSLLELTPGGLPVNFGGRGAGSSSSSASRLPQQQQQQQGSKESSGLYVYYKVSYKGQEHLTRLFEVPLTSSVLPVSQRFLFGDVRPIKEGDVTIKLYVTGSRAKAGTKIGTFSHDMLDLVDECGTHNQQTSTGAGAAAGGAAGAVAAGGAAAGQALGAGGRETTPAAGAATEEHLVAYADVAAGVRLLGVERRFQGGYRFVVHAGLSDLDHRSEVHGVPLKDAPSELRRKQEVARRARDRASREAAAAAAIALAEREEQQQQRQQQRAQEAAGRCAAAAAAIALADQELEQQQQRRSQDGWVDTVSGTLGSSGSRRRRSLEGVGDLAPSAAAAGDGSSIDYGGDDDGGSPFGDLDFQHMLQQGAVHRADTPISPLPTVLEGQEGASGDASLGGVAHGDQDESAAQAAGGAAAAAAATGQDRRPDTNRATMTAPIAERTTAAAAAAAAAAGAPQHNSNDSAISGSTKKSGGRSWSSKLRRAVFGGGKDSSRNSKAGKDTATSSSGSSKAVPVTGVTGDAAAPGGGRSRSLLRQASHMLRSILLIPEPEVQEADAGDPVQQALQAPTCRVRLQLRKVVPVPLPTEPWFLVVQAGTFWACTHTCAPGKPLARVWDLRLPLQEPGGLLTLGLFRESSSGGELLGKVSLCLSSYWPGRQVKQVVLLPAYTTTTAGLVTWVCPPDQDPRSAISSLSPAAAAFSAALAYKAKQAVAGLEPGVAGNVRFAAAAAAAAAAAGGTSAGVGGMAGSDVVSRRGAGAGSPWDQGISSGSNGWTGPGGSTSSSTTQQQQQGMSLPEAAWRWSRLRSSTASSSPDRKILEQVLGSAGISGVASIAVTLHYPGWWAVLQAYLRPAKPMGFYNLGLAYEGSKAVEDLRRRQVYRWLEEASPPIPAHVAEQLMQSDRNTFAFRRLRAAFTRLLEAGGWVPAAYHAYLHLCSWQQPWHTTGALLLWLLLVAMPGRMAAAGLLALALLSFSRLLQQGWGGVGTGCVARPLLEWPVSLDEVIAQAIAHEEVPSSLWTDVDRRLKQTAAISLWLQNFFDDLASYVERAVALASWTDPLASLLFLLVLLAGTAGLAVVGLQPALAAAGLLLLRPPWLRDAAPMAPLRFFWRLPSHSQQ